MLFHRPTRSLILLSFLVSIGCSDDTATNNRPVDLNTDMSTVRRDMNQVTSPTSTTGTMTTGTTTATPEDMGQDSGTSEDMEAPQEGTASLVSRMESEPPGQNCPRGGTKTEQGTDTNQNGVLDDDEVNASLTMYMCNAACTQDTYFDPVNMRCAPRPLIASGKAHTCFYAPGKRVRCWGANDTGQLGDGTTVDRLNPIAVQDVSATITSLDSYENHSCVVGTGGKVSCWGNNFSGQLGDATTRFRNTAVDVLTLSSGGLAAVTGEGHSCANVSGKGVLCWGRNSDGQLGNGMRDDARAPVRTLQLSQAVRSISAGAEHTCVLNQARDVLCWGNNDQGQTGDDSTQINDAPVQVANVTGALSVSAGGRHNCAIISAGRVRCWGDNSSGQIGNGSVSRSPVRPVNAQLPANTTITSLALGVSHTCAMSDEGKVFCWGDNSRGQLGIGTNTQQLTPREVLLTGATAIAITASEGHTCAALDTGGIRCWGDNSQGQLGTGTTQDTNAPVDVVGL